MQITNSTEYIPAIQRLYVESYSKGTSAQYVDSAEVHAYLTEILQSGFALMHSENEVIKSCLLYTSLSFDHQCPEIITTNYPIDKCIYIAEVMVAEAFRGKGLGTILLEDFLYRIDKEKYSDVFLRVWDENIPALKLYEKVGFTKFASMEQLKKTPDGKTDFVMKKIYLHKPLR